MCADPAAAPTAQALGELSAGFRFLHDLFRPVTREQFDWLQSEPVRKAWQGLAEAFGLQQAPRLPLPAGYADFEQNYLATFDVGLPHPPCPLIESHWFPGEPGSKVQHENVLFYRHFGLKLRSAENEPPDHLRHQLEFMSHLAYLEKQALNQSGEQDRALQICRAQADFLDRHLGRWVPRAAAAIRKAGAPIWAQAWLEMLAAWCRSVEADAEQA